MKNLLKISICIATMAIVMSFGNSSSIYKNPSAPVEERVKDLLGKMTLEEKLLLLSGDSTGFDTREIKRLGIPAIHITDGPLGVRYGKSTAFPAGTAMAASWDTVLMKEISAAMAYETKAKGRDYLLGPCVCIQRYPFGGRNFETYSEDPYLGAKMAISWVKGLQSHHVIASVKHFAMNDQEWERNNYNVISDERTMREIHLPVFEAAVCEGGAWSVMAAYNKVNGQHCTENYHLLKDVLKGNWGFKGFVISDWVSTYSTVDAANAGLDLEMPQGVYFKKDSLVKALKEGKITEETINDKVSRLLRVMFMAELFDNKTKYDTTVYSNEDHKKLALKSAEEGIVLLKNQDHILPLDLTKIKRLAVIGPNAEKCRTNGGGSSMVKPYYSVSPLAGLKNRAGDKLKIEFARGDNFDVPETNPVKEKYLLTPDKKQNGLFAEYFNNMTLTGKPALTRTVESIDFSWSEKSPDPEVNVNNFSVRFSGYLVPDKSTYCTLYSYSDDGIRVWVDDKTIINNWTDHGALYDTYELKLEKGKAYKLVVEFYQHAGDAVLQLGWSYDLGERKKSLIEEATDLAKTCDAAIVFAGLSDALESEGRDPATIELPSKQKELIMEIIKANPNTIVVLNGGVVLSAQPWLKDVKALIDMFYLGQETGNAISAVLFGDMNPSGKLPFSFIKNSDQSPACKNYQSPDLQVKYDEGVFVGYRYLDKNKLEPEFPFGFGLSYTTFEYGNMKVKDLGNRMYEVSAEIKNTGKTKGDEIVQLYVSDKESSVPRPLKELKGFSRVSLESGETKTISMILKERDFAFWDVETNNWKVEPGIFDLLVGSSSRDVRLTQTIVLK
jgi:beta-glucosidase